MSEGGPIEAVFLNIDPAAVSGATILAPDYGIDNDQTFSGGYYLQQWGKVESQPEHERYVEEALDLSLELELPLIAIGEEWDPPRHKKVRLAGGSFAFTLDQKWTPAVILAMGVSWGRWAAEIDSASEFLREERQLPGVVTIRVTPNEWLGELIPGYPKSSEARKAAAQRYFEGVFGHRACSDASDAGCIGLWGSRSTRVRAAVDEWYAARKPARKKAS